MNPLLEHPPSEPRCRERPFGGGFTRSDLWVLLAQQEDLQCRIAGFPAVWEHFFTAVIEPSLRRDYLLGMAIGLWESGHEAVGTLVEGLANLNCLHAVWDKAQKTAHDPQVGFEIIKEFRARAHSLVTEFAKFSPRQVAREKILKVLRDPTKSAFREISTGIFAPLDEAHLQWPYDPNLSGLELATRFAPRIGVQKHKNFPDRLPTREQIRELLLEAFRLTCMPLDTEQLHDLVSSVFRVSWKSEFATVSPTGEPEQDDEDCPVHVVPTAEEVVEIEFADAPKFVGQEIEKVIEFRDGCTIASGEGRFGTYFRGYWLWSTEIRVDGSELDVVEFGREHGLEKSAAYQWQEDFEAMMQAALDPLRREHSHGTVRLALRDLRRKWAQFRP